MRPDPTANRFFLFFSDYISGPHIALGRVCVWVSVCMSTLSNEMTFIIKVTLLPRSIACWFILTISLIKFKGQSSLLRDEKRFFFSSGCTLRGTTIPPWLKSGPEFETTNA